MRKIRTSIFDYYSEMIQKRLSERKKIKEIYEEILADLKEKNFSIIPAYSSLAAYIKRKY